MKISDLPNNSETVHEDKDEKKRLKPVVGKDALVEEKVTLGSKLQTIFLDEDIVYEVIIPGFKNMILDALEMIFFENTRRGRRRRRRDYDDYDEDYYDSPSYDDFYDNGYHSRSGGGRKRRNNKSSRERKINYKHIILRYREDAERVVKEMRHRIKEYGSASIADLLDLVDYVGDFTDNGWGWVDPRDISLRRVSEGYLIYVTEAVDLG